MARWRARLGGFVVCGVILAGILSGFAQGGVSTFERITVGSTAVGIASATTNPSGRQQMNRCYARLQSGPIYFRDDGTDPTVSTGTPLEIGDDLDITGNAVARTIRFIRSTSTSGTLNIRCYP